MMTNPKPFSLTSILKIAGATALAAAGLLCLMLGGASIPSILLDAFRTSYEWLFREGQDKWVLYLKTIFLMAGGVTSIAGAYHVSTIE